MPGKKLIYIALWAFLLIDLGYSFLQHYHMPFDGDMPFCIVPAEEAKMVLNDPLGLQVILEKKAYDNPNRFVSHWFIYQYFNHVPVWLQQFTAPLQSVYLSAAIFKTIVQLLIIGLLAMAVSGQKNPLKFSFVLAAALITPFIQVNGYFHYMGIIDQSITYTFFYAFPITLLLIYFMPLFLSEYDDRRVEKFKYFKYLWPLLALACSLSGPTVPAIALVICFLLVIDGWRRSGAATVSTNAPKSLKDRLRAKPGQYLFYLVPISIFSLYSLYLGTFNVQNDTATITIAERYARLPIGFFQQFFQKLGFPVLFLTLIGNTLLIAKHYQTGEGKKILRTFKWIGLFALCYLLLLPLGGYREYRPYILRYDTIMPITLSLLFLFGKTSLFLLRQLDGKRRYGYIALLGLVLFIFTNADEPEFNKNACERKAIAQIAAASEAVVKIEADCTVIAWDKITNPEASEWQIRLLRLWGVIDEERRFYQ